MNPLAAAGGAALVAFLYGLAEARMYHIRRHKIAVLPLEAHPLSVLQVSDLHLRSGGGRLAAFLDSLAGQTYDFVLATGDLLGGPGSVEPASRLLSALKGRHGRFFVLGSSDYYAPQLKNYLDYFIGRRTHGTRRNPTEEFRRLLIEAGWTELTNRTVLIDVEGMKTQITGLDDPYLRRDDRSKLVRKPEAEVGICVVHDPAPYQDAAQAGYDLIVAGHTHGGQVRIPLLGAVVTNSTLPAGRARWASKVGDSLLFVSPGLGTGRYAPFRFLCRPEASVLNLVPRS